MKQIYFESKIRNDVQTTVSAFYPTEEETDVKPSFPSLLILTKYYSNQHDEDGDRLQKRFYFTYESFSESQLIREAIKRIDIEAAQ